MRPPPQRGRDPAAVSSWEQSLLTGRETIFSSPLSEGRPSKALDGSLRPSGGAGRVSSISEPCRPPSRGRSRHESRRRQQRRGLSLMRCHPRAAGGSEPVAEQIKTVPCQGEVRGGSFNTSSKIGTPEALSGSYLDSGDPV